MMQFGRAKERAQTTKLAWPPLGDNARLGPLRQNGVVKSLPPRLDSAQLRRATRHLTAADPVLDGLMRTVGPCRLKVHRGGSSFAYLARAVLSQQISVAAARSIAGRVRERFGDPLRPEDILGAADEELRGLGLSRQKVAYLRDLAERTGDGLPLGRLSRMPDEKVIEALTVVKGIGVWTAQMYLMFRLGRRDVFPVGDLGIRSAMKRAYRMRGAPSPERLRRVATPWRPWRTVACWYLWQSLDSTPT
jgi:DNA-3-methyladenine glycosylase II